MQGAKAMEAVVACEMILNSLRDPAGSDIPAQTCQARFSLRPGLALQRPSRSLAWHLLPSQHASLQSPSAQLQRRTPGLQRSASGSPRPTRLSQELRSAGSPA